MRVRDTDPSGNDTGPEAWQLAAEPLRTGDGKGGRFRPVMCAVVGERSAFSFGMDIAGDTDSAFDVAGRVLLKTLAAARPPARVRVQVCDPELATALRRRAELAFRPRRWNSGRTSCAA